jgi:LPS O-antigen subunit length determinant protein (WzzB/FepE family)
VSDNNPPAVQVDDEIDLKELFLALWDSKLLIIFTTGLFAAIAVLYSLSLSNIYQSTAILAPKSQNSGLSASLQQYAGLASLAGVSIPGGETSESALALELIRSKSFFEDYLYEDFLVELMAVDGWDSDRGQLLVNSDIYDVKSQSWVREGDPSLTAKPHLDEAFEHYSERVSVSSDSKSGLATLQVKHFSPIVAQKWANLIISRLNESLKFKKVAEANAAIAYLVQQSKQTSLVKMDEVFSRLIEDQTQTIMLASVTENFLFNIIQRPDAPWFKSEPNRALICVLGTLLGGMVSVLVVLVLHFSGNTAMLVQSELRINSVLSSFISKAISLGKDRTNS